MNIYTRFNKVIMIITIILFSILTEFNSSIDSTAVRMDIWKYTMLMNYSCMLLNNEIFICQKRKTFLDKSNEYSATRVL